MRIVADRTSLWLFVGAAIACSDSSSDRPDPESYEPSVGQASEEEAAAPNAFPKYAAVTGTQLRVLQAPQPDATVIGWLRIGSQLRASEETREAAGCRGPWRRIAPQGWVCEADGLEVRDEAITIEQPSDEGWKNGQIEEAAARGALVLPPPARDEPMPYDYYLVKESTVPEFHRLPSRNEQRAAAAKADRYRELFQTNEARAARYLRGASEDGPPGTAVTHRYLERGFFVASNGVEVRAFRRFARTTQGRFIKQARLDSRNGGDFRGVELGGDHALPLAWAIRTARPQVKNEGDGEEISWSEDEEGEPIQRQTFLANWQGKENIGGQVMHVLETESGPRYLRAWYAVVAEKIDRPEEVGTEEPWVHVDLSQQTLVMYRGETPIYATIVSSGVEEHATPPGLYEIRRKHVTDTMSNIGPEAESDRYRIEDVPWTQYFEGSFALHTAFWHTRYGIPRSHGCINMSPYDAHWVFQRTWPELPEGWHGASTDQTNLEASHVLVTE